jgi:hypothetical protein
MTRYLISFPSGAMDHIPHEEFPAVEKAAHAVAQEAMDGRVAVRRRAGRGRRSRHGGR